MRQVLPTLDLRTQAQRQGITKTQQTVQAIASILQTVGLAEQKRRQSQTLDRITRAISGGATTVEAIIAAAEQGPEFSTGLPGALQKFGGAFQPGGGMKQSIQQAIIGQILQQALAPAPKPVVVPGTARLAKPTGEIVLEAEPEELSPTQQIASRKLAKIDQLQKKVKAGTATSGEQAMLEKMLAGQPMVQIGLGQPASPTERKEIAETRASLDALDNLKTLFDNAQTKTGPITGRISPIAGLIGMTTDEQEAFMAATSAFKNAIIKEITGAQMSEVEAKRIMKQVPDITDPAPRWNAKWEQSKKNLEFLQKRRLEILQQSGIRVPQAGVKERDVYISSPFRSDSFPTAINPETGERLILINNKWEPVNKEK